MNKKIKEMFPIGGLVIISILMIVSVFMIFLANKILAITGGFSPIYIIAIFFIIIGIWLWYKYITNIFITFILFHCYIWIIINNTQRSNCYF